MRQFGNVIALFEFEQALPGRVRLSSPSDSRLVPADVFGIASDDAHPRAASPTTPTSHPKLRVQPVTGFHVASVHSIDERCMRSP